MNKNSRARPRHSTWHGELPAQAKEPMAIAGVTYPLGDGSCLFCPVYSRSEAL
jgi:hypothetical protein